MHREHLENTFVNAHRKKYTTLKKINVYLGNTQSHPSDFRFTPSGSPFFSIFTGMKSTLKNFGLRLLRLAGALALIYASMVFYLALTERQIAFPRAISHKEAREAIQGKAERISCTLEDGIVLGGWRYGQGNTVWLYYPDTDEDAAQFLAEAGLIDNLSLVTFNYRGSGDNKGTPSAENFENDARQIAECAAQINGTQPFFITGRGVGAILAAQNAIFQSKIILIDPVLSIADKISKKYRSLYPKIFIRADIQMPKQGKNFRPENTLVLSDHKENSENCAKIASFLSIIQTVQKDGATFKDKINFAIQHFADK